MTWTLGIDTSSTDLSIGLYRDDEPVMSYTRFLKNAHAEHISRAVSMVLENSSLAATDVNRIAIAIGPGSFTGLRISLAFIKGFCFGSTIKVLPLSSLLVLASSFTSPQGGLVAAIDARRSEVFWARFFAGTSGPVRETEDCLTPVNDFMNSLRPDDIIITDRLGYVRSTAFNAFPGRQTVVPVEKYPVQRGLLCARLGATFRENETGWKMAIDVLPTYVRPFTSPSHAQRQTV